MRSVQAGRPASFRWGAAVLLALLLLPAPLLPPERLARAAQSLLGVGGKVAYLVATVAVQSLVYGLLGAAAVLAVPRARSPRGRALELVVLPLVLVAATLIVRSVKLGHVPVLANAAVPLVACFAGVGLGRLLSGRGRPAALLAAAIVLGAATWAFLPGASSTLGRDTEACLRRIVADAPSLPPGEGRLGALVQSAFAPPAGAPAASAVEQNRAAILALGIAVGHERLARLSRLDPGGALVRDAAALRQGAALGGREDWARHFWLSAALAVLGGELVSDAGGLVKEELDALAHGTGFSFGDLAADRAGVRLAEAATGGEEAARAMQSRLSLAAAPAEVFPAASSLPENLTTEEFRRQFGGVGDERFGAKVREIEAQLDRCPGLRP